MFNIYADLYEAKNNGIKLFYDVAYLTPQGNEIIAKAITDKIKPFLISAKSK